jgi:hypothetical protein
MKCGQLITTVILFLFSGAGLIQAQNFSLKGRILDYDTKEYIDGASVTLRNSSFGDITSNGGNFELENVLSEKYVMVVKYPGYEEYEQVVKLEKNLNLGDIYMVRFGSEGTGAALQKNIRSNNIMRLLNERPNFVGGNMIYGIPPEPKKVEGNNYLDTKWNAASILLYRNQEMMEGFRVRYNIISNMFELMEPENNVVSVLPGLRIQNIVWMDSTHQVPRFFVNGMDFRDEGAPISGFFEVLVEGELPLLRRTLAVFKESNYNTALMMGNRNDQIIKRNIYYYLVGKDVIQVPNSRKKLFLIFGEKAKEMEEFANSNNMKITEPSSFFQLFTYYNSQFPGFKPIMTQLLEEKK